MTNPAAQLAAMRKTKKIACEVCGTKFRGLATQARYCSNSCRQAAYRARLASQGGRRSKGSS